MEATARRIPSATPEPMAVTEEEPTLVKRARSGDLAAFEILYRRHVGRTHAVAVRMLGDPVEAEDLTQEVWVKAWASLHSFRGESSFTTWLHRLAVNRVLDHLRGRRRHEARAVTLEAAAGIGTRGRGEGTEDRMELERAIAGLPDRARTVFVLHEVEGMKCREVAELTGVAVGTVKAQLHRARRLLREKLTR